MLRQSLAGDCLQNPADRLALPCPLTATTMGDSLIAATALFTVVCNFCSNLGTAKFSVAQAMAAMPASQTIVQTKAEPLLDR